MPKRFIRAASLTGLREVAAECGADVAAAMRAAGLDPALLRSPEERMDFVAFCTLLETCASDWDVPDLGLRVAPYLHLDVLGPVALVTRMDPDLRGALKAICANFVIYSNVLIAVVEEKDDTAAMLLDTPSVGCPTRQYMLRALAFTKNVVEQAAETDIDFIEACLREPAFPGSAGAAAWFGCPVRFGASRNGLYFDRALLDRKLTRRDAAYHALIKRYLKTERHEVAGRTGDAVRGEIARQMELGHCTLETVAQGLRLEPRSLQRRLKAEGLAFRDLIEEWRRQRALSLVTHTRLPLSEVSEAVGYADQSIFTRAFQRWYGDTPLAFRRDMVPVEA